MMIFPILVFMIVFLVASAKAQGKSHASSTITTVILVAGSLKILDALTHVPNATPKTRQSQKSPYYQSAKTR